MNASPTISDDTQEAVFFFHVVAAGSMIAWPFLAVLLGFTFGSLVALGAVYAADRYLAVSKKKAEEIEAVSVARQRYVTRCAKRFFWVRMIPVAVVAYFFKQPLGLVYLLVCGAISVAEVVWENSKLGDMESKVPNQVSEPTAASGRGSP